MWVLFKTKPKRKKKFKTLQTMGRLQQYEVKYHQESFQHNYALKRNIAQKSILMMRRGFPDYVKIHSQTFSQTHNFFTIFFSQMWTTFV